MWACIPVRTPSRRSPIGSRRTSLAKGSGFRSRWTKPIPRDLILSMVRYRLSPLKSKHNDDFLARDARLLIQGCCEIPTDDGLRAQGVIQTIYLARRV